MNIGDEIQVQIESLAFGGDAIARHKGWVIFIAGALPGETALTQITQKKTNFFRATLLQVLQPSPQRIDSPCPYFPRCGGCQYLHYAYPSQLDWKKRQVEDALQRIGKIPFPPVKAAGCAQPFHYRNRVKFHILQAGSQVQLGFMNFAERKVVPIEHCVIASKAINDSIAPICEQIKKSPASKTVTVRSGAGGNVDFWTEDLPLAKDATMSEKVRDKIFETPSASFFQVHPSMTEVLVDEVENFLNPGSEALIDGYCGVGLFGVVFSKRFQQIVGIEQDRESVRWARKNMRSNGTESGVYYEGRVEDLLEKAFSKIQGKRSTVILDPPRDGVHKNVVKLLCQYRPGQIIYVSCNPPTLARDLGRLSSAYRISGVTLVDMFPQTMHCEVVAALGPA